MATAKDKEFARIAISLGFIEQQRFTHFWNQYSRQATYKPNLTFAQWLVQNKLFSLAQVATIEHQIINSLSLQENDDDDIDADMQSILESDFPEPINTRVQTLDDVDFSDVNPSMVETAHDNKNFNKNIPQTFIEKPLFDQDYSIPNTLYSEKKQAKPIPKTIYEENISPQIQEDNAFGQDYSIPNTLYGEKKQAKPIPKTIYEENISPQIQEDNAFGQRNKLFPNTKVEGTPSTVIDMPDEFAMPGSLSDEFVAQKIQPGKKFGRYDIINEIGRGGMGKVYKVYDPESKRIFALKVLLTTEERENQKMGRFLREAFLSSKFDHPNIVTVYDIGNEAGQVFFTMDFIEGETLDKLIKQNQLTRRQTIDIMIKVSSAVAHAHGKKIIHRDLKPENIIIDVNGEPKVMDFGLAKIINEDSKLSKSGMIIGTVHYMAPEQADGLVKELDERSDTYALGAILYELLTGRPPYEGSTFSQVIDQILYKDPTPPSKLKKRIPKNIEKICLKAIEKEKEDRYQTANDLAKDLTLFSKGQPVNIKSPFFPKIIRKAKQQLKSKKGRVKIVFVSLFLIATILAISVISRKENKVFSLKDNEVQFSLANSERVSKISFDSEETILVTVKWLEDKKVPLEDIHFEWSGNHIENYTSNYQNKNIVNYIETPLINNSPGDHQLNIKIKIKSYVKEVVLNYSISKKYLFRQNLERTGQVSQNFSPSTPPVLMVESLRCGVLATPVVVDDIIFIACVKGHIHRLDVDNRKKNIIFAIENKQNDSEKSIIKSSPSVEGEYLYFGAYDSSFYAINKNTGKEIWKFNTLGHIASSPLIHNDKCYFGSNDQFLYCLNRFNGKEVWSFHAKGKIFSSPAFHEEVIYFGSNDQYLYALNAQTGEEKWKYKVYDAITSIPAIYNGKVFIASNDGYIHVLDCKTGNLVWKNKCAPLEFTSPTVTKDHVIVAGYEGLNILDTRGGEKLKFFPSSMRIYSSPIITKNGSAYCTGDDGVLYVTDIQNMYCERITLLEQEKFHASPVLFKNSIFLISVSGRFVILK